ncbi:MAG TPA: glycogen-binding domain-containing protein [Gemmatimonadales bacterium]|nr:glycogen-binding domain-containing protein [Gemmatimonadales bacterium]
MNTIDPRIHEVLDGVLSADVLPPGGGAERAVRQIAAVAAVLAEPVPRASVESRVMAEVRRPAPSAVRRLIRWIVTPRAITFRIRPAWSLAFAATVAALTVFATGPWEKGATVLGEHEGIAQFVGRFPGAQSVHVVGSFNDWRSGSISLEDRDHDGVWRAIVVLPAGTYEYMFVVDGERWVPDHLAEQVVADEFGRENSVMIVRPTRR